MSLLGKYTDNLIEEEENTRITDDDVKRLKAMAENYLYNEKKESK